MVGKLNEAKEAEQNSGKLQPEAERVEEQDKAGTEEVQTIS